MSKQTEKLKNRQIVIHNCHSWSSSFTREMSSGGKAASIRAIQAIDHNVPYFYLEEGKIVQGHPESENIKS